MRVVEAVQVDGHAADAQGDEPDPDTGEAASRQAEVQAYDIARGKTVPEMMLFPYIRKLANP
jgi:hypothetical protein